MDSAALVAKVRRQTLVPASELSDQDILDDLNLAQLDVASRRRWPFHYATGTISLVDGTTTYDLPEGLMFLEELIYDGQGITALDRTSIQAIKARYGDVLGDSDLPTGYFQEGIQVTFVPTPDADQDVIVKYYGTPADFTEEGGTPAFHSAFHAMLADFAIAAFWEREEMEDRANFYLGRFEAKLESMAEFYRVNWPSEPLIVGGGVRRPYLKPYTNWPEV